MTRLMKRDCPIAAIVAIAMTGYVCAAYSIAEPTNNAQFSTTSTIPCRGDAQSLGETVTIKLMLDMEIVDAANATAPPMDIDWETELEPPTEGWEASDEYVVELWAGNRSEMEASVGIDIN